MAVARDLGGSRPPRTPQGGPRVAGVELAAGLARVVVARAEGGRLRVLGRGESGLGPDAVRVTACSNAGPFAIRVAEVTMPSRCAFKMARLMPAVRPKSSALMISRRTAGV